MARYEDKVLDDLEKMVESFEERTSAELVVVLSHKSESYADVPFKAAAVLAFAVLALLIYLPVDFSADLVLVDTLLAFMAGWAFVRVSPFMFRLLTTAGRREESVKKAARAAFTARGVSLTRERNGVLVYISWLERRVELIPDVGVDRCLSPSVWNTATRKLVTLPVNKGFPKTFIESFGPLAEAFAEHMPCSQDNPDEIPNRPVVM